MRAMRWDGLALAIGILGLARCGDEPRRCGEGTSEVNGRCAPEVTACGEGLVAVEGRCVAAATVCAPGTHVEGGICVADLTCGPGTHAQGASCVPDTLPPPDVVEAVLGPTPVTLPAPGASVRLGGTVDLPSDEDGDGWEEPDWDAFSLTVSGPTYLRVTAVSEGVARPTFKIVASETRADGSPRYERCALRLDGQRCARELYLPLAGTYLLWLTDYNHLSTELFGAPTLPAGGPEFTYQAVVENLGAPQAEVWGNLPRQDSGALTDGRLHFYQLEAPAAGTLVSVTAVGRPELSSWSDVIGALLLFDAQGQLLGDRVATGLEASVDLVVRAAGPTSYLAVHDFYAIIGPLDAYRFHAQALTTASCGPSSCASFSTAAAEQALLRWELAAGDFFVVGLYPQSGDYLLDATLLDEQLQPIGQEQEVFGLMHGAFWHYAEGAQPVYLWLRERFGQAVPTDAFALEVLRLATPPLTPGNTYTGLTVHETPPGTVGLLGIGHTEAQAGQILAYYDFAASAGWTLPQQKIYDPRFATLGPVLDVTSDWFPYSELSVAMAYVPRNGHYLHIVQDEFGAPVGETYDVRVETWPTADLGPVVSAAGVTSSGQALDRGLRYFTFLAPAGRYLELRASPTIWSDFTLQLWAMNFGYDEFSSAYLAYVWTADPTSPRMGLVGKAQAPSGGTPVSLGYFSPYSGRVVALVMSAGSYSLVDRFDLTITVPPPPANDACLSAQSITLGGGGTASVTGNNASATDDVSDADCLARTAPGPDVFYRLYLTGGEQVELSLQAAFNARLYLFSSCSNPATSCVAGASSGTPRTLTYDVPAGADGFYLIGVDSAGLEGGPFTLDVEVRS